MPVKISFHGAAECVTGSCYRVSHDGGEFLVDCGLFQGLKSLNSLNWRPFPFDVTKPRVLLLTHAHIDHSGLLPKLARDGFKGDILATQATIDLAELMLRDSAYIQESEAHRQSERRTKRGEPPVETAYTMQDAETALRLMKPISYMDWVTPMPGLRARWWDAGHMLGSGSIEVEIKDGDRTVRILFSGDIGPGHKALSNDPDAPKNLDVLVCESTYGDRERADVTPEERRELLRDEVMQALRAGGNLIIPVFAVERTQELLYDLDILMDSARLPEARVFLDSPLAAHASEVFTRYFPGLGKNGGHPFLRRNLHIVGGVEESKQIARFKGSVIMAASGMCEAGRVRHHLKNNLWRPESTVLMVGYQAAGSLGRLLIDGAKRVRIHGEEIAVRARIRSLDVYSGHADQKDLLTWIGQRYPLRQALFLTHGEEPARATLRELVERKLDGVEIFLPRLDETFQISADGVKSVAHDRSRTPHLVTGDMDWHSAYAETVLRLSDKLRTTPGVEERNALLKKVRELLGA